MKIFGLRGYLLLILSVSTLVFCMRTASSKDALVPHYTKDGHGSLVNPLPRRDTQQMNEVLTILFHIASFFFWLCYNRVVDREKMGRRFGGRNHKKPKVAKDDANGDRVDDRDKQGYESHQLVRENEAFSAYYRLQGLVPEDEWDAFIKALQTGLPSTFRVTGHRQTAMAIQKHLEEVLIPGLPEKGEDGTPCPVPTKIPWYPNGLGWNMVSDRKALRTLPQYQAFHQWLKAATENGDISRQEAVSMIPPLLLDVRGDHLVLDMCAAPGSKTAQLVEQMHSEAKLPSGMVIANDLDQKRAYLLHHQVKRILSPCLMVTNNDGSLFPAIFQADSEDPVQFDRILADVPCSGDGTMRKNPGIWREWSPASGIGLHGLQVRLLERALQMTKVGGKIVYSTCSMNPIEDEAVLAAILTKYSGKVQLVDCSESLPGLKRLQGVHKWTVTSRDGKRVFEDHSAVPESERSRYPETLFSKPEYSTLGLERGMRILPHLQNTGGFFIALLEKIEETTTDRRKKPEPVSAAKEEEPEYFVIPKDHHNLVNIMDAFGIDQEKLEGAAFVSRVDRDPIKSLAFVSPALHKIMAVAPGQNPTLRVVNVGARAFEIYDVNCKRKMECPYRVLTESASLFEEVGLFGPRKRVEISPEDLKLLINTEDSVLLEALPSIPAEVKGLPEGALVLVAIGKLGHKVIAPAWKGERSIKAFIPKPNRPALLYQLE